jgi:ketosteroid isomerase-like protein
MSNDSLDQATTTAPEIIRRYLAAADAQDSAALADCFTADGTVVDEGRTYVGRDAIRGWRDLVAGTYTYTTEITGSESSGEDSHQVRAHVEGDFPGGQADLTYSFALRDGLIAALQIG